MKNNKFLAVLSTTAISTMVASILLPTVAYAADGDIYNISNKDNIKLEYNKEQTKDFENQRDISLNSHLYGYEYNGKIFKFDELTEKFMNAGEDFDKAIVTLDKTGEVIEEVKNLSKVEVKEVSGITTTDVTVKLADGFDTTKAADVKSYAIAVNGVEAVNPTVVTVDAIAKTAKLSIALVGQEGSLTVNSCEASKFDFKKPVMTDVKALDAKHIQVTFSEKVAQAGAETIANYSLFNYATNQLVELEGLTGGSATAKLQADGKTVVITFSGNITDGKGFVVGGLTNGKYLLYVDNSESTNKVQDLAATPNVMTANTNFEFTGTTTPAEGSIKAISSAYNKAAKTLSVTFSEPTDATDSSVVAEKFALSNGTTSASLKGATVDATSSKTVITFDLKGMAEADYVKVAALTGDLSVVISDGAYKDANTNLAKGNTVAVKQTVVPVVTGAEYNEETNVLKLSFDQDIDLSKIVAFTGITVNGQAVDEGATLKSTVNGKTVEIQLAATTAEAMEKSTTGGVVALRTNTVKEVKVEVAANLFTKVGATVQDPGKNVATTIAKATVVQDATAPTVQVGITGLGTGVGELVINASEELDLDITGTSIKFYAADDLKTAIGTLDAGDVLAIKDANTNSYKVTLDTHSSALATSLNTAVNTNHKKIVMVVEKGAIKDINLTDIAAVTTENAIPVSIAEANYGATVASVTKATESSNLVVLNFKDGAVSPADVQLDKAIAEGTAKYEFVSKANPNLKVAATANYVWGTTTSELRLIPSQALLAGDYELTITGLKTNAGKAVEEVATPGVWTEDVTIEGDVTKPQLVGATKSGINVVDTDKSGNISAGDQIVLSFNEAVKLNGATAADFIVNNNHSLGSAKVEVGSDITKVVITLTSDSTIAIGDAITVAETDKVTDLAGNKVDAVHKVTGALAKPAGVAVPLIKEVNYADTNADGKVSKGDTLTVKFDQVVKAADNADLKNDIKVGNATFSAATLNGDTLTLTIDTPDTIAVGVSADIDTTNVDMKNGWGDEVVTSATAIAAVDKVAPTVQAITVGKEDTQTFLYVKMSEAVNLGTTPKFDDVFEVVAGTAEVTANQPITLDANDPTVLKIELGASDVVTAGLAQINVKLKPKVSTIMDASGNNIIKSQGTAYTVTAK